MIVVLRILLLIASGVLALLGLYNLFTFNLFIAATLVLLAWIGVSLYADLRSSDNN